MGGPPRKRSESVSGPRPTIDSDEVGLEFPRDDDLGALRPFGVRKTWPAGATLFRLGDLPEQFFVRLTQRDLASVLGLGRQTVSRELGKLELLGLVRRGRGQVRVLDPEGLRALLPR